jgi:uncharacterized membrane protein YcgQ (UPF0703/DUF1980 family)
MLNLQKIIKFINMFLMYFIIAGGLAFLLGALIHIIYEPYSLYAALGCGIGTGFGNGLILGIRSM